ncbi:see oma family member [Aphelenchoides avenae]|nr:see oma family member [Aphelenchus avenae]
MNSSHLFLPLCSGKQQHPAPMSDITEYVNPNIHGDGLAVGGFAKRADDKQKENNYKTVMCRSWLQSGSCSYGKKCRFAHGEHELREPARRAPEKHKTKLCQKYIIEGLCPYGVRCDYIHPAPSNTAFYQHRQQEYMPTQHPTGYPQMMYAVPGMYGTLAGPPCYPLSLLPYTSCTRRADDLAHFYGQQPMFFEDNNLQFSRLTDGCGFPTGGMSHLIMRMNKPWNDCDQAAMPVMCDLSGNINGTSKPRAPLLPLVSRNEASYSAALSDLVNGSNNNFTAEQWNGHGTMPQMCGLFGNVNDASKPRRSLLPLESCDKAVSCSAAYSHPTTNNSEGGLATAPLCTSTPVPKSFTSSLGSDIWSPEKRMSFDPVSIQEVGEKPLHASADIRNRDSGYVENFKKWIAGLGNSFKAHECFDKFNSTEQPAEKKHSSEGTAPSECASDELFVGQLTTTDFSWLWEH